MLEKKLVKTLSGIAVSSAIMISPSSSDAQEKGPAYIGEIDPAARLGVLGVNVVSNGLLCGILGAAEGRDFFQDMGKCMGGATIQYIGMEMGVHDVPVLPGFGLRAVETGTSIIDNTLAGKEPFEMLHYGLGPGLLTIDTKKGKPNFYWRIMPTAGIVVNFAEGYEFNFLQSLSYQTPVFNSTIDVDKRGDGGVAGYAIGNIINFDQDYPDMGSHEITHVFQYIRARPAQLLVPDGLSFLEETLHLRIGEDAMMGLLYLPGIICNAKGDIFCSRQWWNIIETEAYIMQTGSESYKPIHQYPND